MAAPAVAAAPADAVEEADAEAVLAGRMVGGESCGLIVCGPGLGMPKMFGRELDEATAEEPVGAYEKEAAGAELAGAWIWPSPICVTGEPTTDELADIGVPAGPVSDGLDSAETGVEAAGADSAGAVSDGT